MQQYLSLLQDILENGVEKTDRTGTGTVSVFGRQLRFNLQQGFPLITTKKLHLRSIVYELLWFLNGDTNSKNLEKHGVNIWKAWSKPDGSLGKIYGKQWCRWEKIELKKKQVFTKPEIILESKKVAGVGYNTKIRNFDKRTQHFYNIWSEMLHRCYNPLRKHFNHYGEIGVFVDTSWHDFEQFFNDVQTIPNSNLKKAFPDDYELDKDYFATNKYSKDTCIWLTRKEQTINTSRNQLCIAKNPDGIEINTMDIAGLCRDHLLDVSSVYKCLRGERTHYKHWTFQYQKFSDDVLPRLRIFNQIVDVIAGIKNNPDSRRLIVSAWNVGELDEMALPPCHLLFQFYVANNRLSCQLYQRSADVFLGVPFNIASYALLVHLIAQQCDLEVGEFVWTGGDCHLYVNHIEQAKLQLSRTPFALPSLNILRKPDSIFTYDFADFEILNYQAHPHIKAAVAV